MFKLVIGLAVGAVLLTLVVAQPTTAAEPSEAATQLAEQARNWCVPVACSPEEITPIDMGYAGDFAGPNPTYGMYPAVIFNPRTCHKMIVPAGVAFGTDPRYPFTNQTVMGLCSWGHFIKVNDLQPVFPVDTSRIPLFQPVIGESYFAEPMLVDTTVPAGYTMIGRGTEVRDFHRIGLALEEPYGVLFTIGNKPLNSGGYYPILLSFRGFLTIVPNADAQRIFCNQLEAITILRYPIVRNLAGLPYDCK